MDESWRIPIGSTAARRRSTEERRRELEPEDFRDVFGGPPRSVLQRRFSADLSAEGRAATFYDEIFRGGQRPRSDGGVGGGRSLPGFSIPAKGERLRTGQGFYDDIFGSGDALWRSKSKSKSKPSSVMSSEELSSPLRPSMAVEEDVVLSSFASKLRPIMIPSRQPDSSPTSTISRDHNSYRGLNNPCSPHSCFMDFQDSSNNNTNLSVLQSRQHYSTGFPPSFSSSRSETLKTNYQQGSLEMAWSSSLDPDSPSSVTSSVFLQPMGSKIRHCTDWDRVERELEKVVVEVEQGDAMDRSFIIKIDRHEGKTEGAACVDEAIAWAKEKFWNPRENTPDSEEIKQKQGNVSPLAQVEQGNIHDQKDFPKKRETQQLAEGT